MIKFLPIVVVLLIIFTAGVKLSNLSTSPTRNSVETQSEVASESAELEIYEAPDTKVSGNGKSAEKVPTKTFKQNGNTYTSQNFDEKVVMKGRYSIPSYDVDFLINLPKSGGAISGSLSGGCEGVITGDASKQNENNTAQISGKFTGKCLPLPLLGYTASMAGTFEGKVYYDEGKAAIVANTSEPISVSGSYFEMLF